MKKRCTEFALTRINEIKMSNRVAGRDIRLNKSGSHFARFQAGDIICILSVVEPYDPATGVVVYNVSNQDTNWSTRLARGHGDWILDETFPNCYWISLDWILTI